MAHRTHRIGLLAGLAAVLVAALAAAPALGDEYRGASFTVPSPGSGWMLDSNPGPAWQKARFEKDRATIAVAFEPSPEPNDPERFVREPFDIGVRELGYRERTSSGFRTAAGRPGFLLEWVDSDGRRHFAQIAVRLKNGMVSVTLRADDAKTYEAERGSFLRMAKGIRASSRR